MDDLIEALQIFKKYCGNEHSPIHCEHDTMYMYAVDPADVSPEDIAKLDTLGFWAEEDEERFASYRFGSC